MAYRTYVGTTGKKDIQLLGNNEFYQPFIDELKRQGYYVDDDGCYGISFEDDEMAEICTSIKDIQPIIEILEQYIWDKDNETKEYSIDIFNLRPNEIDVIKDFTIRMKELQENGYIFVTANLIKYLWDNLDIKYDREKRRYIFKIKDGKDVWFSAY